MSTQLPAPGTRWCEPDDDTNLWAVFQADPGGFPVLVARWLDEKDACLLVHGPALIKACESSVEIFKRAVHEGAVPKFLLDVLAAVRGQAGG